MLITYSFRKTDQLRKEYVVGKKASSNGRFYLPFFTLFLVSKKGDFFTIRINR